MPSGSAYAVSRGSLVSPLPPRASPCGAPLEVSLNDAARVCRSSPRRRPPWPSARLQRDERAVDDPGGSSSSHGVRHEAPLHRSTAGRPLPAPVARVVRRTGTIRARHVPSSRFLTAPTVCSGPLPAGLLHPAPGHGVRALSGVPPTSKLAAVTVPDPHLPFEDFPSSAAAPRHRGRCPLGVHAGISKPHTAARLRHSSLEKSSSLSATTSTSRRSASRRTSEPRDPLRSGRETQTPFRTRRSDPWPVHARPASP